MPFPLAHPAAVLPLRRYSPRYLSFPALVIGSLVPDFGYFFNRSGVDEFSHSFLGSLGFGLPVGLLALGLFYGLEWLTAQCCPVLHQRVLVPFSEQRASPAWSVILSLLLGCWTHLLLDSITHRSGWVATHLPFLQVSIGTVQAHNVRLCHVLWYGFSFFGMAWLFLAFRGWQEVHVLGSLATPRPKRVFEAVVVASLLLPIEIVHYLVHGKLGLIVVAVLSLVWAIGVAFKVTAGAPVARSADPTASTQTARS